jgi:hypothetical protein
MIATFYLKGKRLVRIKPDTPGFIIAPTLTTLLKLQAAGKLKTIGIARFLAAARAMAGEAKSVALPIEFVDLLGQRLVSKKQWDKLKTIRAERSQKTAVRHAEVLALVDKIERQHPGLSPAAIAQRIARRSKYAARTIRELMAKRKK